MPPAVWPRSAIRRITLLVIACLLAAAQVADSRTSWAAEDDSPQPALTDITGDGKFLLATEGVEESAQSLTDLIDWGGEMGYPVEGSVPGVSGYFIEDAAMLTVDGQLIGCGKLFDIQTIDEQQVITGIHLHPYSVSTGRETLLGYDTALYAAAYEQLLTEILSQYDERLVKQLDAVVPYRVFGSEYRRTVLEDGDGDRIVIEFISFSEDVSFFSLSYYSRHHVLLAGTAESADTPSLDQG